MRQMNKPRRQHPMWMLYQIGKLIKSFAFPVIIFGLLLLRYDHVWAKLGILIPISLILYEFISVFFRWKNNTYIVIEQVIHLNEGRLNRKKHYIALRKIQHVQQQITFFHRFFKTTSLTLQTGTSSADSAINFEMIPLEEARRIQALMENIDGKGGQHHEIKPVTIHYKMTWKEIIMIAFTSLYIVAILAMILSAYVKIDNIFSIDSYTNQFVQFMSQSCLVLTFIIAIAIMLSISAGVLFTFFRVGKYQVTSDEDHIYISKGIINTTFFTIPRNKINGVMIEKSMTRRLFRIVTVKLITVNDQLLDNTLETYILFSFIHEKHGKQLIEKILPPYKVNEDMSSLPEQAYFIELIQPSYILVIGTFLIFFFWPEFWFIPILYALYLILKRVMKTKQQRYIWTEQLVQMQTGTFSTKIMLTKRKKIDALVIDQSWMERKLGLASIKITSRANPIQETVMEHVSANDTTEFYHWFQQK